MAESHEVRDSRFYEEANRALKVGYYVRVFIQLGANAASVLAMPAEGWNLARLKAEEIAGHEVNLPGSDRTKLMIVEVLRKRELMLAKGPVAPRGEAASKSA